MAKLYPGDTVTRTYTFTDENGDEFDPDTVTVLVVNPSGEVEATLGLDDLVKTATGVYLLRYNLPGDAAAGVWRLQLTATVTADDVVETEEFPFSVSTQPYGSLSVVKHLCSIGVSDTSKDDVVLVFMEKATGFVNEALVKRDVTLPLGSPVPDAVVGIAEFYAAGLFLQKDQQDEKAHSYLLFAMGELEKFGGHRGSAGKVVATRYSEIDE